MNNKGSMTTIAVIGIVGTMMAFGATMEAKGQWGKDGKYAVKNCVGTHTNGNCSHLPLNKFELAGQGVDWNNFANVD